MKTKKSISSKGAQTSLSVIHEYLGEINYKDERSTSSYDFKEAIFDGATVTCTIENKKKFSVSTTNSFKSIQQCYQTGICTV